MLDEVRTAPADELEAALSTPARERILRGVFGLVSELVDPEAAAGVDATVHFKIWDRPGGGYDHIEIAIRDGAGHLIDEPSEDPTVTIKGRAADLLRLALGEANPIKLGLQRRIGVQGDINFARKLSGMFKLPDR